MLYPLNLCLLTQRELVSRKQGEEQDHERGCQHCVLCDIVRLNASCSQSRHLALSVLCKYCMEKAESSTVAHCLKLVVSAV